MATIVNIFDIGRLRLLRLINCWSRLLSLFLFTFTFKLFTHRKLLNRLLVGFCLGNIRRVFLYLHITQGWKTTTTMDIPRLFVCNCHKPAFMWRCKGMTHLISVVNKSGCSSVVSTSFAMFVLPAPRN